MRSAHRCGIHVAVARPLRFQRPKVLALDKLARDLPKLEWSPPSERRRPMNGLVLQLWRPELLLRPPTHLRP